MTLQQFFDKWLNKYQERRDSSNLNQCFDLALGYCYDVLGLPLDEAFGLINAWDIFYKYPSKPWVSGMFEKIPNTLSFIPQPGDMLVWKGGTVGHVAVADFYAHTTSKFGAFSQNDPIGSKCVHKIYNYNNFLGVLRPKDQGRLGISENNNQPPAGGESNMNDDQKAREMGKNFLKRIKANGAASSGTKDDFSQMEQNDVDNLANEFETAVRDKKASEEEKAKAESQLAAALEKITELEEGQDQNPAQIAPEVTIAGKKMVLNGANIEGGKISANYKLKE